MDGRIAAVNGLYIENRHKGSSTISEDLAKHLYTRALQGNAAVVTDNPVAMLSSVRKQWLKIERHLRRERSSTLNASKILELTHQITRMQTIRFTAKAPRDDPMGDVEFATLEDFVVWAPECRTLYVTCAVTSEQLHLVTGWMPKNGLVVVYEADETYRPTI